MLFTDFTNFFLFWRLKLQFGYAYRIIESNKNCHIYVLLHSLLLRLGPSI